MKKIFFLIFILSNYVFSQQNHEYFGTIKLNKNAKKVITYRIVFSVNKSKINGFSITDLGGNHETKNKISGTYNSKTKEINFKEENILYTKSSISDESFCFINFVGKVKLSENDKNRIEGNFKGLYKNKTKCIDGSLLLVGLKKIEKKLNKINSKIQKSSRFDQATKNKINPVALLDSLKVNSLTNNQNLNVFVASNTIEIEIWDSQVEDGDVVNLFHNGKRILTNYEVVNKKKILKIDLEENKNQFRIEAVSEGQRKSNTASIRLVDKDRNFELSTNLKVGEKALISIIKN